MYSTSLRNSVEVTTSCDGTKNGSRSSPIRNVVHPRSPGFKTSEIGACGILEASLKKFQSSCPSIRKKRDEGGDRENRNLESARKFSLGMNDGRLFKGLRWGRVNSWSFTLRPESRGEKLAPIITRLFFPIGYEHKQPLSLSCEVSEEFCFQLLNVLHTHPRCFAMIVPQGSEFLKLAHGFFAP